MSQTTQTSNGPTRRERMNFYQSFLRRFLDGTDLLEVAFGETADVEPANTTDGAYENLRQYAIESVERKITHHVETGYAHVTAWQYSMPGDAPQWFKQEVARSQLDLHSYLPDPEQEEYITHLERIVDV